MLVKQPGLHPHTNTSQGVSFHHSANLQTWARMTICSSRLRHCAPVNLQQLLTSVAHMTCPWPTVYACVQLTFTALLPPRHLATCSQHNRTATGAGVHMGLRAT
jgi:hypothetical protein